MKREAMVRLLAPPSPPCFSSRTQWVEYLSAHAAEQRIEHEPGPLVFSRRVVTADTDAGLKTDAVVQHNVSAVLIFKGRYVTFNRDLSFCSDCSSDYRQRMVAEQRCRPGHLWTTQEARFDPEAQ